MYSNTNKIKEIKTPCHKKNIHIVLSGGGARGEAYSGMFAALVDCNILDQVISFSSSSAGSLASALIATGISKERSYKLFESINLKTLFNTDPPYKTIWNDGKPLREFFAKEIWQNIKIYLDSIDNIHETIDQVISELQKNLDDKNIQDRYNALVKIQNDQYKAVDSLKFKEPNKVTFADLSILRLISPQKFKELNITGTREDSLDCVVFNAKNTLLITAAGHYY